MNESNDREKEIFNQALEQPSTEARDAYLQSACGEDSALRGQIEDLLKVHQSVDGFLPTKDVSETELEPTILTEESGSIIGRYKLLEKLGEGGFGSVWAAEQKEPVRRRVALKIIKLGMDTKQVVARFGAERQALALMDHPNIAKVLDAGATDTGRPYFVMELVKGVPITQYCEQEKFNPTDRINLFIKVCQAIQHAHQKGIIHRDIKPSNIMVTLHDGVPVPKVIDFGIAKATQHDLTEQTIYTQYSQFIGTPAYMSPEQAELSGLDIDTRSDIYSLGVLLYELLTGSTPFDTKELMQSGLDEMRKIIREQEPVRPSTRLSQTLASLDLDSSSGLARRNSQSTIETDIDWIVMKCLEKDRSRRYDTANGLALDLNRYLTNEPVVARPPSAVYRFQKAWRRNKVACTSGICVLVALVVGLSVAVWQANEANQRGAEAIAAQKEAQRNAAIAINERNKARAEEKKTSLLRAEAQKQARLELRRAYAADMNLVQRHLELSKTGEALELLNRYQPEGNNQDIRGWEWRYLRNDCRSDASFGLPSMPNQVTRLSVSNDGRWLSGRAWGREEILIDVAARRIGSPPWLNKSDSRVLFAPRHPLAVTTVESDGDFFLNVINLNNGMRVESRSLPSEPSYLAFSSNGDSVGFYTWQDRTFRVLRVSDGEEQDSYSLEDLGVNIGWWVGDTNFSPDLNMLWSRSPEDPSRLRLIDLSSGEVRWERPTSSGEELVGGKFSPDSKTLVTNAGFWDGTIQVWDVETGNLRNELKGHRSWIIDFDFLDDGRTLVSASGDQTIRLWDLEEMKQIQVLTGQLSEVWEVTSSPGSDTLISGGKDGHILLWNLNSSQSHEGYSIIETHSPMASQTKSPWWSFSADSGSVLSVDADKNLIRWSGERLDKQELLCELGTETIDLLFSEDGRHVATVGKTGEIYLWNLDDTTPQPRLVTQQANTTLLEIAVEKGILIALHQHGADKSVDMDLQVIDLETGAVLRARRFLHSSAFIPVAHMARIQTQVDVSSEGRWWSTFTGDGMIQLWDLKSNELASTAFQDIPMTPILSAFSPDNRFVAVAIDQHQTRVYEVPSGKLAFTLKGHLNGVKTIGFSADMQRLVTGGGGQDAMKIWDFEYRLDLLTLKAKGSFWTKTRFSPNGDLLGSMSTTGQIHIWRAPSWEEIEEIEAKQQRENEAL